MIYEGAKVKLTINSNEPSHESYHHLLIAPIFKCMFTNNIEYNVSVDFDEKNYQYSMKFIKYRNGLHMFVKTKEKETKFV